VQRIPAIQDRAVVAQRRPAALGAEQGWHCGNLQQHQGQERQAPQWPLAKTDFHLFAGESWRIEFHESRRVTRGGILGKTISIGFPSCKASLRASRVFYTAKFAINASISSRIAE